MIKVTKLLAALQEIIDNASSVPLTGKLIIDGEEVRQILEEIEECLPDEIKQARWIEAEKDRILAEAKEEYNHVVKEAKKQAEHLVDKSEILEKSRARAEQLMDSTNASCRQLKIGTYDYIDKILYEFQVKLDKMSEMYKKMYKDLDETFEDIAEEIDNNRSEIHDIAFKTSTEDGKL